MLSFKPTFSLSSFIFIKRLFSSSSLSAIRVVSSAYLRLLIVLPAIEDYSAIKSNAFDPGVMRWMKLEPIIPRDVGQKEKDKYCILIHIYGI